MALEAREFAFGAGEGVALDVGEGYVGAAPSVAQRDGDGTAESTAAAED